MKNTKLLPITQFGIQLDHAKALTLKPMQSILGLAPADHFEQFAARSPGFYANLAKAPKTYDMMEHLNRKIEDTLAYFDAFKRFNAANDETFIGLQQYRDLLVKNAPDDLREIVSVGYDLILADFANQGCF